MLADPVFDKDDERIKLTITDRSRKESGSEASAPAVGDLTRATEEVIGAGGAISRLPFSRAEAEAILSVAPKAGSLRALDFNASRATATSTELSQFQIVHFAAHGLLNRTHPELSGIVLSLVDRQGKPQDGFLQLHDVYNLDLPAELIVLSACQTGLGKSVWGEGLVGITRGFMYAGTKRVVSSLWGVQDLATAELMKRFYRADVGREANETRRGAACGASRNVEKLALALTLLLGRFCAVWRMVRIRRRMEIRSLPIAALTRPHKFF